MFLDKIKSLKNDIWELRKKLVIESMVYNTDIDREFTDLLIKYKVLKLNELKLLRNPNPYS